MITFTTKFLVALICLTAIYLGVEAVVTNCAANTPCCIRGPPGMGGRNGRDGIPGRDGRDGAPGPPSTLNETERELLKEDILNTLRQEVCQLNLWNSCKPTCKGRSEDNPAASCKEIYDCNPGSPSGNYWISTDLTGSQEVYCEMRATRCGNITGGWTRVAHINMSDPEQTCPSPLGTLTSPQRMCIRETSAAGCSSVQYPTQGLKFTQVCGRAIGYMYKTPDGMDGDRENIDNAYVDGLSITYGSPRHHLWTYAAGVKFRCLCQANNRALPPPSFVGQHYYCDGWPEDWKSKWYPQYPLWDGEGCPAGNTCCDPPNLPWFHRTLGTASADDMEVRWCRDEAIDNEDVGVDLLELYVY